MYEEMAVVSSQSLKVLDFSCETLDMTQRDANILKTTKWWVSKALLFVCLSLPKPHRPPPAWAIMDYLR